MMRIASGASLRLTLSASAPCSGTDAVGELINALATHSTSNSDGQGLLPHSTHHTKPDLIHLSPDNPGEYFQPRVLTWQLNSMG